MSARATRCGAASRSPRARATAAPGSHGHATSSRRTAAASTAQPAGWDTTLVADGLYDLRVIATDVAGNSTTSPLVTTRVDNTPPALTFSSPAAGTIVSGTVTLSAARATPRPRLRPSASRTSCTALRRAHTRRPALRGTRHPAGRRRALRPARQATDDAANTTSVVNASVLCRQHPAERRDHGARPAINGSLPSPTSFSANASDPAAAASSRCSSSSAPTRASIARQVSGARSARSRHPARTRSRGTSRVATATTPWRRSQPTTPVTRRARSERQRRPDRRRHHHPGKPADPSNAASPTFTFSSTESGSTFECRVDGGSWSPVHQPGHHRGLTDGVHTFDVRATDAAGNTDPSPGTWTWHRDTAGPAATLSAQAQTSGRR